MQTTPKWWHVVSLVRRPSTQRRCCQVRCHESVAVILWSISPWSSGWAPGWSDFCNDVFCVLQMSGAASYGDSSNMMAGRFLSCRTLLNS